MASQCAAWHGTAQHSTAQLSSAQLSSAQLNSAPWTAFVSQRELVMFAGAHNTIVTARAGKDLVSCLVSGLLTIGPRFGGAVDDSARYFQDACDRGTLLIHSPGPVKPFVPNATCCCQPASCLDIFAENPKGDCIVALIEPRGLRH